MFVEENSLYRKFTRIFHILGAGAAIAIAYQYVTKNPSSNSATPFNNCTYANVLFLISWAINLGITFWVSFVAGPVMIKYLHRHTFGEIQSHLFPFYFFVQGLTSVTQMLVYCYLKEDITALSRQDFLMLGSIGAGVLCGFLNGLWFGPTLSQISFKRAAMEKEEGVVSPNIGPKLKESSVYSKLRRRFGMLHGISTLLNLFSLAGNMYVLYFIAASLINVGTVPGKV